MLTRYLTYRAPARRFSKRPSNTPQGQKKQLRLPHVCRARADRFALGPIFSLFFTFGLRDGPWARFQTYGGPSMRDSAQVTSPGALNSMIAAMSTRPTRQNRSTCSRMSVPIALTPPPPCEPVHMRCAPMRRTALAPRRYPKGGHGHLCPPLPGPPAWARAACGGRCRYAVGRPPPRHQVPWPRPGLALQR
jgi:hypothetical protein